MTATSSTSPTPCSASTRPFTDKTRLILNLSFSGYYDGDVAPPLIAFWIRELVGQGAVVVAAAGNDGACRQKFPAAMPEVLAVGSLGPCGPSPFSNHGPWVDASRARRGPGERVLRPLRRGVRGDRRRTPCPDIDDFSGWAMWSGTSFATPTVVGALAEIVEACDCPAQVAVDKLLRPARAVPHARLRHRRQSGLLRISEFAYQRPVTALMTSVTMHRSAGARTSPTLVAQWTSGTLLRRVIEGDQRAWDELVGRFGGLVWSIARGYRLGALTDDVVQTVWLRLAENCDRIRDPERLAAWLATTTRNEALRVSTKQARTRSVSDLPERADTARVEPRRDRHRRRHVAPRAPRVRPAAGQGPGAAAAPVHGAAARLRHDRRDARTADRQHRPEPRARAREAQEAAPARTRRPSPTAQPKG